MVIERKEALREIEWRWSVHPALALIGPRECGKTTLAAAVAAAEPEVTRFDLGNEDDFRRLADRPQQVLAPLGVSWCSTTRTGVRGSTVACGS